MKFRYYLTNFELPGLVVLPLWVHHLEVLNNQYDVVPDDVF